MSHNLLPCKNYEFKSFHWQHMCGFNIALEPTFSIEVHMTYAACDPKCTHI